jgi:hypothetical protein
MSTQDARPGLRRLKNLQKKVIIPPCSTTYSTSSPASPLERTPHEQTSDHYELLQLETMLRKTQGEMHKSRLLKVGGGVLTVERSSVMMMQANGKRQRPICTLLMRGGTLSAGIAAWALEDTWPPLCLRLSVAHLCPTHSPPIGHANDKQRIATSCHIRYCNTETGHHLHLLCGCPNSR